MNTFKKNLSKILIEYGIIFLYKDYKTVNVKSFRHKSCNKKRNYKKYEEFRIEINLKFYAPHYLLGLPKLMDMIPIYVQHCIIN